MSRQEQAAAVIALVAEGKSLRKAAEEVGIKHPTFLLWCDQDKALADQYARARATGTDAEFEDLDAIQSEEPVRGPSGAIDAGWVAWKRLQVDTKKWALSKKAPKKYGDKLETTHEVGETVQRVVREIVRA